MRRMIGIVGLVALAAACEIGSGSGDDDDPGEACTLIGCDDQLTVQASSALGSQFGVELEMGGQAIAVACEIPSDATLSRGVVTGSSTLVVDCAPDGIVIYDLPEALTVRFLDEDGTVLGEGALTPAYETLYPNGEECGAVCDQGDAVVQTSIAANPNPQT